MKNELNYALLDNRWMVFVTITIGIQLHFTSGQHSY